MPRVLDSPELPDDPLERAIALQQMLTSRATGGAFDQSVYTQLRDEMMRDPTTRSLLPRFVRTCRLENELWTHFKDVASTYHDRRVYISNEFAALLEHVEGRAAAPADAAITEVLSSFNEEGVHRAWQRALDRRVTEPEGAITAARTLLETVCKHILELADVPYGEHEDLPKLYGATAKTLNLAPSQHTEDSLKAILGGCHTVVQNLGTLRNRLGDAHGEGRRPYRPAPRHAALAVNLAGSMATFLVETWLAQHERR
jgi:hypothetical protein